MRERRWTGLLALTVAAAAGSGGCARPPQDSVSYLVRLKPGQELSGELARLARDKGLRAASVVSAVGSLTDLALRFADRPETTRARGHFEVVSLSGYLAAGELHLHMAVSDGEGKTIGGHVMPGNVVYTTLVVVVQDHPRYRYRREHDAQTGRDELVIDPR